MGSFFMKRMVPYTIGYSCPVLRIPSNQKTGSSDYTFPSMSTNNKSTLLEERGEEVPPRALGTRLRVEMTSQFFSSDIVG